ncbi:MAG: cohesin domain-containing protein [Polyangiaceae bacterium]
MRASLLGVVLASALSALACSSDSEDSGGKPTPKRTLVFRSDARPAGSSVTLRQKELGSGRLVLELVGNSVDALYGVAFRLRYDPKVLGFEKVEASPHWGASPPLALASEKTPGLVVLTLTEKGKSAGVSGSEVVLGTLAFQLKVEQASAIDVVVERSGAVGADGRARPAVGWAGGDLVLE